jgi:hypothetical protein
MADSNSLEPELTSEDYRRYAETMREIWAEMLKIDPLKATRFELAVKEIIQELEERAEDA